MRNRSTQGWSAGAMEPRKEDPRLEEVFFLLRPAEVAAILRLNRNTIYKWLRLGILTRIRLGGSTYISGRELLDQLAASGGRMPVDHGLHARARAFRAELRARGTRNSERRPA